MKCANVGVIRWRMDLSIKTADLMACRSKKPRKRFWSRDCQRENGRQ